MPNYRSNVRPGELPNPEFALTPVQFKSKSTVQNLDKDNRLYLVTTSGSGGTEPLNLVTPSDTTNPDYLLYIVHVQLQTLTGPSDTVPVQVDGVTVGTLANVGDSIQLTWLNGGWSVGASLPTPNKLTMINDGTGAASGTTFDGSSAKKISYNSVGAQPTLVSGTNIKTINSASILFSGDIALQTPLVSGTSIKTVAGVSLLGSGDVGTIDVPHGGTGAVTLPSNFLLKGNGVSAVTPSSFQDNGTAVGLNLTPIAGATAAFQIAGDIAVFTAGANVITFNCYYASGFKTRDTGYSAGIRFDNSAGNLQFYNSPTSSTSGSASTIQEVGHFDKNGNFMPTQDNIQSCGAAGNRWSVIYAGTGTINTSDEREKTWRGSLTKAELAASKKIISELGFFQWDNAIAKKGWDNARYHFGVRAQRVWEIMAEQGLVQSTQATGWKTWKVVQWITGTEVVGTKPTAKYAFLCYDEDCDKFGVRLDQLSMFLIAGQEQRLSNLEALFNGS